MMMRTIYFNSVVMWAAAGMLASPSLSAESPSTSRAGSDAHCQALANTDFSGILDAPTQVLSAEIVGNTGDPAAYCRVHGYVAPQVGFELRLPVKNWNGKFLQVGCGGYCGVLAGSEFCPVKRGYACITSDTGHKGNITDSLWALDNLQAKVDWGYRAPHVTTLAGKAITEHFYQAAPSKSYFVGASTGGRQALQEAQRFPWDFDGIVAIVPPVDISAVYLNMAWGLRATHANDGSVLLGSEQFRLLQNSALAQCDLDDGVRDRIIGDPLHCAFDPSTLACRADQTTGCLTPVQVDAVKKIYAGPETSSGLKLSLGGPEVGSEVGVWGWEWFVERDGHTAAYGKPTADAFRHLYFASSPGSNWQLSEFDFDRDFKRLGMMQALYESGNPNLRKFHDAGGKLLIIHGLNDITVLPRDVINYYETVERTMGGRAATESFVRLYLLPGVGHMAGDAGADMVDFLGAIEHWVEKGKAPDRLVAARLQESKMRSLLASLTLEFPLEHRLVEFTRPIYPYPTRAKYTGRGDPKDASNFGPAKP